MKKDLVSIECDYCGNHDTFNIRDGAEVVFPIIRKWRGVTDGDAPPAQGADSHRWYDTLECLIAGEKRHEREKQEEEARRTEQDRIFARAQEQLNHSPYMAKA